MFFHGSPRRVVPPCLARRSFGFSVSVKWKATDSHCVVTQTRVCKDVVWTLVVAQSELNEPLPMSQAARAFCRSPALPSRDPLMDLRRVAASGRILLASLAISRLRPERGSLAVVIAAASLPLSSCYLCSFRLLLAMLFSLDVGLLFF